jgi:hypothetical protein
MTSNRLSRRTLALVAISASACITAARSAVTADASNHLSPDLIMGTTTKPKFIRTANGNIEAYNPDTRRRRSVCRALGISGKRLRKIEKAHKRDPNATSGPFQLVGLS